MTRSVRCILLLMVSWLIAVPSLCGAQSNLDQIKHEFQATYSVLKKHYADFSIDCVPETAGLMPRFWRLSAEWLAAWLNEHPSAGPDGVEEAFRELDPEDMGGGDKYYEKLSHDELLVVVPSRLYQFGNVFIVAKSLGQYRPVWSTAQHQKAKGKLARLVSAWLPERSLCSRYTPPDPDPGSFPLPNPDLPYLTYPVSSPTIGILPADAQGRDRFFIDGMYETGVGATVGKQISFWVWDGATARPLLAHEYGVDIDAGKGIRLEENLFKIGQLKSYRTFSCMGVRGECQADWVVRLTPSGVEDLGKPTVPELDAVDELFFRIIHHRAADDIASASAVTTAKEFVAEARRGPYWDKKIFGMGPMLEWKVDATPEGKILSLSLDNFWGRITVNLKRVGGRLFITDLAQVELSDDEAEPGATTASPPPVN